ncbi:Metal tolerance protein 2 [Vitis vinifera]|uniref:Metal tolerance protein 2 n=1 Tax=Vitis vinifera TaxID=29760 RepID=A0A438KH37_VITVI|nr:Metal tolerance protein 2 [Vitis vinifera]
METGGGATGGGEAYVDVFWELGLKEAPDLCPPVSANYFLFQLRFCAAMGFRFQNLNSIHKTLVSRISSHTHGTLLQTPNFPNPTTRSFIPQSYDPSSIFPTTPFLESPEGGILATPTTTMTTSTTTAASTAIIADAAHSASDVVLSGVALWSYKVAKAPKDKEHPYGHSLFVPTSYSIDLIMHI